MRLGWGISCVLAIGWSSACSSDSESSSQTNPDASTDAGTGGTGGSVQTDGAAGSTSPDADATTTPQPTGSPCSENAECEGGLCLTELIVVGQSWELPEGYCSQPCTLDTDCDPGSTCYQQVDDDAVDVGGACVKSCTRPTECRSEYTCDNETCLPSTPVGAGNGAWGRTWSSVTGAHGAAVDSAGNVYTVVSALPGANLGGGALGNSGYFHVSFTGAGVYRWAKFVGLPALGMAGGDQGYFTAGGDDEITVAGYDVIGTELWAHAFPAGLTSEGTDVAASSSGHVAVAGRANGKLDAAGQNYVHDTPGISDGAVVLIDPAGTPLWGALFGSGDVRLNAVAFAPNGDVWTAGRSTAFTFAGKPLANAGVYDVVLTRHSAANGSEVNGVSFGGTGSEEAIDLAIDDAGNLFVAGPFTQTMQVGTETLTGPALFAASFADDGSFRWAKAFGSSGVVFSARITPDGKFRVAGDFQVSFVVEGTTHASVGNWDVFMVEFDTNGAVTDSDTWGAPPAGPQTGEDHLLGFAIDQNGANFFSGTHNGPIDFGSGELLVGGAFLARVP
jgi:hypothetical protein